MELDQEQYQKIASFLDGEMSITEMEQFDYELKNNHKLHAQLKFEVSVRDELTLREQIVSKKTKTGKLFYLKIASTAAVLAVILWVVYTKKNTKPKLSKPIVQNETNNPIPKDSIDLEKSQGQKKNVEKNIALLFSEYFKKDTVPKSLPIYLAAALEGYAQNDFEELLKLDKDNLPQTRGNKIEETGVTNMIDYYKAIALCQNGEMEIAQKLFLNQITSNSKNSIDSKWYLALINIKQNNKTAAIQYLYEIENSTKYKRNIQKILEKLSN